MYLRRFWLWTGLILFSLLLTEASLLSQNPAPADTAAEKILAIADIHGDFDDFSQLLKHIGVVDQQNHWTGKTTKLIQTGDVIDRGPKGREAMDLLIQLQKEATDAGGQVVPLLGNHEVMNLLGDLRYVTPEDYAEFADKRSEERRKNSYQEYATWYKAHQTSLAALNKSPFPAGEEQWTAAHPLGFVECREAFSPKGTYGRWIRNHAAVAKQGRILFLHGGISPNLASMPLDEINAQIHKEIENFDHTVQELISHKVILPFFNIQEILVAVQLELHQPSQPPMNTAYRDDLVHLLDLSHWLCMREDGPLWFRGYDGWSDDEGALQIDKVLTAYGADRVVVGHTVQKSKYIRTRFGGKVFLIDTGMLSTYWPGGRASALEFIGNKVMAQYPDGSEDLMEQKPQEPAAKAK
jgi:hypothetical protein